MQQLADLGIAAEEPETGWCFVGVGLGFLCVWEIQIFLEVSGGDEIVLGFFC